MSDRKGSFDDFFHQLTEEEWQEIYLQHARAERRDVVPFPEPSIQQLTNSACGEDTAKDAIGILQAILRLTSTIRVLGPSASVLDFGCGWGRITRLLPFYFRSDGISGVDVDARLIDSANHLIPAIRHRIIQSMRPLPMQDETFDLVFANSVFSHLSAESHRFAAREIARTLKPGGVAVVSVLDRQAVERFYRGSQQRDWIIGVLGDETRLDSCLEERGFHWGSTGRWDEYGIAVVSEPWVRNSWLGLGLQLTRLQRGDHERPQLFCAFQKTG